MAVCPQLVPYFMVVIPFSLITLVWASVRCVAEVRLTMRVVRERRAAHGTVPAATNVMAEAEAIAARAWAVWQGAESSVVAGKARRA